MDGTECPACGGANTYEEYTDVVVGVHHLVCADCGAYWTVDIAS
ncbi:MAG: Lar family restriction alleviation protein [Chloroflexi bacterium]|nr:Lar family restriction alleviation protein [Chloroflexota bacterium]